MALPWASPVNYEILKDNQTFFSDGIRHYKHLGKGIYDFVHPQELSELDQIALNFYDGRSENYDKYLHLTFETYCENEIDVRSNMIDKLELAGDSKVLEVACGTGRDSVLIDQRLNQEGQLCLTDISYDMINKAYQKLENSSSNCFFGLANALHLPFPTNYFDALYSFGGLGEFSNPSKFFQEAIRVCKPGAKVVVGDENLPTWQRKTLFGKILANYNKQFLEEVPFSSLPVEAREVKCEWIIGGVFYLIDFRVGVGEPKANFDFKIPGVRGGTHKTRYFGNLEGVSEETKKAAILAREKLGISMHDWLDKLIMNEATKIISEADEVDS